MFTPHAEDTVFFQNVKVRKNFNENLAHFACTGKGKVTPKSCGKFSIKQKEEFKRSAPTK